MCAFIRYALIMKRRERPQSRVFSSQRMVSRGCLGLVIIVVISSHLDYSLAGPSRLTLDHVWCKTIDECDEHWVAGGPYVCSANDACGCTENSTFSDMTCKCNAGFVISGRKCLAAANALGLPCEVDVQCTLHLGNNTTCYEKHCSCMHNTISLNNTCLQRKALGQICTRSEQCFDTLSTTCQNNICVCSKEFTPNIDDSMCLKRAHALNESCEENSQCLSMGDAASCRHGTCVCENEYFFHNTQCILKIGLGQKCNTRGTGCYLEADGGYQNVNCINEVCTCSNTTVPDSENKSCVTGAGMQLIWSLPCMLVVIASSIIL